MRKLFTSSLLLIAFLIACATGAQAQSAPPSGQFGIGAFITTNSSMPGALSFAYAVNRNIHVGTAFGLMAVSGGGSSTYFLFAPYFEYVMDGTVSPFFSGGFGILSAAGTTYVNFSLGGGLAYYWAQHFGVHVDLDIINLGLSPSPTTTVFGFYAARMGAEWYLGR